MRALCHLAKRHGKGLVHIRDIASKEEIPPKFLEGILLTLKRAGVVRSRRGNEGGYALALPPGEIGVGDVIRILDGPLAPLGGSGQLKELLDKGEGRCGFYAILLDVHDAVSRILDHSTLLDVLKRSEQLEIKVSKKPHRL